jgi:hypothetical protein
MLGYFLGMSKAAWWGGLDGLLDLAYSSFVVCMFMSL